MEYRKLGRTGLEVGVIGLGTEYLYRQPRETVVSVVRRAIERGVNYFDLLMPFPDYRDDFGVALQGFRERVVLAGHLGATVKDGQYCKSRSADKSEPFFHDLLARLGTDTIDVLLLHNFNTLKDYEHAVRPRGLLDLARRLQQEGKARFIGLSAHRFEVATRAIESGHIDVLMLPLNIAGSAAPGKKELLVLCARRGIGLVAMKPFVGGKLLRGGTVRMARYLTGGDSYKQKLTGEITPVQCLSYVLSQAGVCTAVPGVKNEAELDAALHYLEASDAERDYGAVLEGFAYQEGECVYCNHCLPCPAGIDIGQTTRLLDLGRRGLSAELRAAYEAMPAGAGACTECGACVERCPFGVDVIENMRRARQLFERRPEVVAPVGRE
jgi:predicted aldo/keto reductase-like oxidoreductase